MPYAFSTGEKNATGDPILQRIDNGWKYDKKARYSHIFKTPEPYFKDLRAIMLSDDVANVLERAHAPTYGLTQDNFYDSIQPFLEVKGFFGFRKVIITRHRFHLFLRWCDQNGDLFE